MKGSRATSVKEAGTNKVGSTYSVIKYKVKPDVDIKAMLKRLYEQKFTEPLTKFTSAIGERLREVSYGSRKSSSKQSFSSPTTLKSTDASFQNNKSVVASKVGLHETVSFIRCTRNDVHFNHRDIYKKVNRTYSHFLGNVIVTVNICPC